MIVTRHRRHKINTGEKTYESLEIGASVTFDTETDSLPKGVTLEQHLTNQLDDQLAIEVEQVVNSGTLIEDSHVFDYYEFD